MFCSRTRNIFTNFTGFTKKIITSEIIELWKQPRPFWKAKTFYFPNITSTISYVLKLFSIGGDNLCEKSEKIKKSQFWTYISTLKKKTGGKYLNTQYNNISGTRYTYSRRKTWKYNIWWLPVQFYTHIMYRRSQSELRYDYFLNFLYLSN